MSEILQWVLIGLSVPLIVVIVLHTIRRARELDARIDEFHAEQEAAKNQPGPVDPYAGMAELFGKGNSRDARRKTHDSRPTIHDPRPDSRK